jgi:hypothetical protein
MLKDKLAIIRLTNNALMIEYLHRIQEIQYELVGIG